jgi:cellobiose phosphorylase
MQLIRTRGGEDGHGTRDRLHGCTALIVESLLGLRLEKDKLALNPCLPADWDGFTMHYRFRETIYHINVRQKQAVKKKQ